MASIVYNSFLKDLADNNIDLGSDTINVMLVQSTYTPDKDHNRRNDITNEASGSGYSSGGSALASVTTTQDDTNDWFVFDAADLSFGTVSISFRYIILYKSRGGASSADELIICIDTGATQTYSGSALTLTWSTSGIFRLEQVA